MNISRDKTSLCSSKYFMSLCHVPVLFLHFWRYAQRSTVPFQESHVEKFSFFKNLQKIDLKLPQTFTVSHGQRSQSPTCFLYLLCFSEWPSKFPFQVSWLPSLYWSLPLCISLPYSLSAVQVSLFFTSFLYHVWLGVASISSLSSPIMYLIERQFLLLALAEKFQCNVKMLKLLTSVKVPFYLMKVFYSEFNFSWKFWLVWMLTFSAFLSMEHTVIAISDFIESGFTGPCFYTAVLSVYRPVSLIIKLILALS